MWRKRAKDAQQLHLIAVAIHNTAFSRTFLVSLVYSDNLPSVPTYTIEETRLHH